MEFGGLTYVKYSWPHLGLFIRGKGSVFSRPDPNNDDNVEDERDGVNDPDDDIDEGFQNIVTRTKEAFVLPKAVRINAKYPGHEHHDKRRDEGNEPGEQVIKNFHEQVSLRVYSNDVNKEKMESYREIPK